MHTTSWTVERTKVIDDLDAKLFTDGDDINHNKNENGFLKISDRVKIVCRIHLRAYFDVHIAPRRPNWIKLGQ